MRLCWSLAASNTAAIYKNRLIELPNNTLPRLPGHLSARPGHRGLHGLLHPLIPQNRASSLRSDAQIFANKDAKMFAQHLVNNFDADFHVEAVQKLGLFMFFIGFVDSVERLSRSKSLNTSQAELSLQAIIGPRSSQLWGFPFWRAQKNPPKRVSFTSF